LVTICKTTWCGNPEDHNLKNVSSFNVCELIIDSVTPSAEFTAVSKLNFVLILHWLISALRVPHKSVSCVGLDTLIPQMVIFQTHCHCLKNVGMSCRMAAKHVRNYTKLFIDTCSGWHCGMSIDLSVLGNVKGTD
jgi:hypothetical protein